ncbi:CHASE2 domain-containing protein [Candidatus Reidiella endopervernicosa]|uniref:CHASE2 domain-containing protein n=1 Tax=Candidatus Reidiella endopervernicosa TaxID=2738883 RepID=A0A6N0HW46_9GAMM|nr:CHASE2 domain-containing protein [Candidatus Reidiella endopervernicosa]QKQ26579.1 CHASE2 domain-containing protein [Candidatus Reidiella endopervernicosa]
MVSHSTKQKRGGSRLTTRLLRQLLPAVVVVTALLFDYFDPLLHSRIQHYAFDQLQQLSPAPYDAELPLRVIAIDDESLLHNGQWPWSRDRLSELLDRLTAMGAAVVVLTCSLQNPIAAHPSRRHKIGPCPPS